MSKKTVANFEEDFQKHMSWLLVGSRIPIEPVVDWNKVELFGMASVKEGKKPRQYHFFCGSYGSHFPIATQMTGPTCNARGVMKKLKELLSEENWVADNVIQTPLRAKIRSSYFNNDWYIQRMVSEALDFEQNRLFWYIRYLQEEHLKKHKR